jgi:UDP-glucose 4-epimerase
MSNFLLARGGEVAILDRNTESMAGYSGLLIRGDAQSPEIIESALLEWSPDCVYHFAANSDISAGIQDSSLDFGDTLMTTLAVVQALKKHPVKQLVFASSSAIFGQVEGPIPESLDQFLAPESWYGKAKFASEYVLDAFSAQDNDTSVLITRFPNVVGPLATHGVVYDFVRKLRSNPQQLQVLGNGYQDKPYVHVSDLIEGIEFFRRELRPNELQRINLGPTDTVSVRSIAKIVSEVLQVDPKISYQDQPEGWIGDIPKYEFDTAQMRSRGFSIECSSRDAIRRAAEDLSLEISSL